MSIDIARVRTSEIAHLRELYRREMSCQIVHDSLHARGFTDAWLLHRDGQLAGYASLLGFGDDARVTIIEFYVLPAHRARADELFERVIEASGAKAIQAQTNDRLLTLMLYDRATNVIADKILFEDAFTTAHASSGGIFRRVAAEERSRIFPHTAEPVGEWMIDVNGEAVATGGIMLHYNPPYGDIYMEVAEPWRRRGHGTFLVQELKRVCYESGRVPAARCVSQNDASRATLQRAGMLPCARILKGTL